MIRGAIFDFDGTLVDSMFIWKTAGDVYLRSLGKEPDKDLQKTLKTMSLRQSAMYMQQEYGLLASVEEIMGGINRTVEAFYFNTVQPKADVIPFLNRMKEQGIKMCIATATDRYQVEAALWRCGMDPFFSDIFTCSDVGHGKDEPVIFRKALEHLQTTRADTIVFEDAFHALETAKNDGFITAAVYDPHEERQKELCQIADLFLDDYSNTDSFWKFAST